MSFWLNDATPLPSREPQKSGLQGKTSGEEQFLGVDENLSEERMIENYKLCNPKSPCGPSIFQK